MSSSLQSQKLFDLYRDLDRQRVLEAEEAALSGVPVPVARSEDESRYALSQTQLMWRKFVRNRAALVGGIIVVIFYFCALFANFLAPYTLSTRFRDRIYLPPQPIHFFDNGRFAPFVYGLKSEMDPVTYRRTFIPDEEEKYPVRFFAKGEPYKLFGLFETDIHLFQSEGGAINLLGTDRQGRDMLTRILIGSQISLTIGLVGVFLSLTFGTILGVVSGYFGGAVDDFIQRLIELIRSFPSIPLWMALSAAVPVTWPPMWTYFAVTVILSLIGWTWLARQLRGQVLALRQSDYIMAARLAGASDRRIIFKHLFPATLGQIIVVATLSLPSMIIAETSLSFMGLGLRPPITSWGVLLQESQNLQSLALYPWVFTPAIVIVIVILAFSFLGDGLRDAADPFTI